VTEEFLATFFGIGTTRIRLAFRMIMVKEVKNEIERVVIVIRFYYLRFI
jgi:hypothetical protein